MSIRHRYFYGGMMAIPFGVVLILTGWRPLVMLGAVLLVGAMVTPMAYRIHRDRQP